MTMKYDFHLMLNINFLLWIRGESKIGEIRKNVMRKLKTWHETYQ